MFLTYALVILWYSIPVLNQGTNNNNYGPYDILWEQFETCKGPKQSDCGKVHLENTENMSDVIFVMDFAKDCPVTKAKVIIGSKQNDNTMKKLWNYALDSPCQHFVLGPVLTQSFNLTSNCKVNKGFYRVHVNMTEKSLIFLGTSFFYGTYQFKVFAHNKAHNFFCVTSKLQVVKKEKPKLN